MIGDGSIWSTDFNEVIQTWTLGLEMGCGFFFLKRKVSRRCHAVESAGGRLTGSMYSLLVLMVSGIVADRYLFRICLGY